MIEDRLAFYEPPRCCSICAADGELDPDCPYCAEFRAMRKQGTVIQHDLELRTRQTITHHRARPRQAQVIEILEEHPGGLTDREMGVLAGCQRDHIAAARQYMNGRVQATGEKRHGSRVWRLGW